MWFTSARCACAQLITTRLYYSRSQQELVNEYYDTVSCSTDCIQVSRTEERTLAMNVTWNNKTLRVLTSDRQIITIPETKGTCRIDQSGSFRSSSSGHFRNFGINRPDSIVRATVTAYIGVCETAREVDDKDDPTEDLSLLHEGCLGYCLGQDQIEYAFVTLWNQIKARNRLLALYENDGVIFVIYTSFKTASHNKKPRLYIRHLSFVLGDKRLLKGLMIIPQKLNYDRKALSVGRGSRKIVLVG